MTNKTFFIMKIQQSFPPFLMSHRDKHVLGEFPKVPAKGRTHTLCCCCLLLLCSLELLNLNCVIFCSSSFTVIRLWLTDSSEMERFQVHLGKRVVVVWLKGLGVVLWGGGWRMANTLSIWQKTGDCHSVQIESFTSDESFWYWQSV